MYDEPEILAPEEGTIASITKGEVNSQVSTARAYPRSMQTFRKKLEMLVTKDPDTAASMMYALPRGKDDDGRAKTIEGPSARFAEALASAWGNLRIEARPIAEGDRTITSRGTAWDMESNVAIAFEVSRRITGRSGKRFNDDMISVTANAAGSIALRNAVLKVVPKSEWEPFYQMARRAAIGDAKTLVARRKTALEMLMKFGAANDVVLAHLGKASIDDIDLDDLAALRGLVTALKEGDITVENAFGLARKGDDRPAAPQRASEATATEDTGAAPIAADAGAQAAPEPAQAAATHTVAEGGPTVVPGPATTAAAAAGDDDVEALPDTGDEWRGLTIHEVTPLGAHLAEIAGTMQASKRSKPTAVVLVSRDPLLTKLAASCLGIAVKATVCKARYRGDEVDLVTAIEAEG